MEERHDAMIPFLTRPTGRGGVDLALRGIVLGLVNGRYEPGEKLNAGRIAKELEVGLVPVREALHLLAGQGVVELLPQRGARVRGMTRAETRGWHAVFQAVTLIGVRAAAGAIAERPQLAGPLREATRVLDRVPEAPTNVAILDRLLEFHRRLNAAFDLELLDEASRRLQVVHWIGFVARYASLLPHREAITENYRRLAAALERGDADGACAAYDAECALIDRLVRDGEGEPAAR